MYMPSMMTMAMFTGSTPTIACRPDSGPGTSAACHYEARGSASSATRTRGMGVTTRHPDCALSRNWGCYRLLVGLGFGVLTFLFLALAFPEFTREGSGNALADYYRSPKASRNSRQV